MAPSPSSPERLVKAAGPSDPELLSLPRPPRQGRTISLVLMATTALLALVMTAALLGDVRYAMNSSPPADLGDLAHYVPGTSTSSLFVRGSGLLNATGAIRYDRPMERDTFRLAPLAGNDKIWVEMRVPPGIETGQFVPPTTFVGRLLPMQGEAFRYRGLARSVQQATGAVVPGGAWVLVDGATPASARWTVALAALFAIFAVYNLATIARIVRPVRR